MRFTPSIFSKLSATAFLFSLTLVGTVGSAAESKNPIRTVSFDSGYLQHSSRAFWNFGKEVDGVVSVAADNLNSTFLGDFLLGRVALGAAFYLGWNHFEYNFFVSNHELGHGNHFASIRSNLVYKWSSTPPTYGNIFTFFAHGFNHHNDGAQTIGDFTLQYASSINYQYLISASGMNNSNEYAESIENQIAYGGGGHLLQYIGYIRGKQDASTYVDITDGGQSGDVAEVVGYYNSLGYGVTPSQLKTGSLVARWASSTNWAFIWSSLRYAWTGDPLVRPIYLGPIKAPDVSHYITSRGLSYKVRGGLRGASAFFPLAVEYIYRGEKTIEATLGYHSDESKPSNFGLELSANSRGGLGVVGSKSFGLSTSASLNLGASFYTENSVNGDRRIARYLSGGAGGYEAWARISARY